MTPRVITWKSFVTSPKICAIKRAAAGFGRVKQINATVDSLELNDIIQPQRVVVGHKVGDRGITSDLLKNQMAFDVITPTCWRVQTPPKQVLMFEEPENGIYPGEYLILPRSSRQLRPPAGAKCY